MLLLLLLLCCCCCWLLLLLLLLCCCCCSCCCSSPSASLLLPIPLPAAPLLHAHCSIPLAPAIFPQPYPLCLTLLPVGCCITKGIPLSCDIAATSFLCLLHYTGCQVHAQQHVTQFRETDVTLVAVHVWTYDGRTLACTRTSHAMQLCSSCIQQYS